MVREKILHLFQLVQSFKEIRVKGVAVIQKMSADIAKKAQEVGSNESKQDFVDACESLKDFPQVRPFNPPVPRLLTVPSSDRIEDHCLRSCQIRRVS